jgi:hypothetical protein
MATLNSKKAASHSHDLESVQNRANTHAAHSFFSETVSNQMITWLKSQVAKSRVLFMSLTGVGGHNMSSPFLYKQIYISFAFTDHSKSISEDMQLTKVAATRWSLGIAARSRKSRVLRSG